MEPGQGVPSPALPSLPALVGFAEGVTRGLAVGGVRDRPGLRWRVCPKLTVAHLRESYVRAPAHTVGTEHCGRGTESSLAVVGHTDLMPALLSPLLGPQGPRASPSPHSHHLSSFTQPSPTPNSRPGRYKVSQHRCFSPTIAPVSKLRSLRHGDIKKEACPRLHSQAEDNSNVGCLAAQPLSVTRMPRKGGDRLLKGGGWGRPWGPGGGQPAWARAGADAPGVVSP